MDSWVLLLSFDIIYVSLKTALVCSLITGNWRVEDGLSILQLILDKQKKFHPFCSKLFSAATLLPSKDGYLGCSTKRKPPWSRLGNSSYIYLAQVEKASLAWFTLLVHNLIV